MPDGTSVHKTVLKPTRVGEKILIASKDDGCRQKMQNLLTDQGFPVQIVQEDANVLLELLSGDYALVIYDLEMSLRKILFDMPLGNAR